VLRARCGQAGGHDMLKMLTGIAAAVIQPFKAKPAPVIPGTPTDSEMLDWMEARNGTYTGHVVFRWSGTGRGWRVHEIDSDYADVAYFSTVREAIMNAMMETMVDTYGSPPPTDTEMLNWLDSCSGRYTGKVIWRWSTRKRGWRLHETSWDGCKNTVRETIAQAMTEPLPCQRRLVNAALCLKCGDLPISRHRHDYVSCECNQIAVDGGNVYRRMCFKDGSEVGDVVDQDLYERLLPMQPKERLAEWKAMSKA